MLLAGIQANFGLDLRLKHSEVTTGEKSSEGPLETLQVAAELFIIRIIPDRCVLGGEIVVSREVQTG